MKRGDLVTVVLPGAYGKPRPAVVVQADALPKPGIRHFLAFDRSTILRNAPIFRVIVIDPTAANGLQAQLPGHG